MKKALAVVVALLVCLVGFLLFREDRLFSIGLDGFLYPGDDVKASLVNGVNVIDYEAVAVSDSDDVILKRGEYFVDDGDRRAKVSVDLPLVSDDGARLLILTQGEAVTDAFVTNTTFRGAVIASGTMYNLTNGDQVDSDKYLFVKTKDGLFINVYDIFIRTLAGEKRIPANSLIFFEKNNLRFYSLNGEKKEYNFNVVNGIDSGDVVKMAEKVFTYGELISNLGVWNDNITDDVDDGSEEELIEEGTEVVENENIGKKDGYVLPDDAGRKMEVSAKFIGADTYSAKFNLSIYNPNDEIVRYPTVVLYHDDEVYLRKTFYASAESEVAGLMPDTQYDFNIMYVYKNEKGNLIQVTLDKGSFRTGDLNGVEPVSFSYGQIDVRANDATINNLMLKNNITDRVLRGLEKIILNVNGQEIKFGASLVSALKRLDSMNYKMPEVLDSNRFYHLELKAYDVAGNELRVENAGLDLKTTRVAPKMKVVRERSDYTWFEVEMSVENPDEVNIENLRYVLLDKSEIVDDGAVGNDMVIKKSDLEENKVYKLLVYADYDLDDGVGNRKDQLMLEANIATEPVEKLGKLYLTLTKKDVEMSAAVFGVKINSRSTMANLVSLVNAIKFEIKDSDGKLMKVVQMSDEEMGTLRQLDEINLELEDLEPNHEYFIDASGVLKQGNIEYPVDVILSLKSFRTFKEPATVEMINKFITASMIDFETRVVDTDGCILSDRVLMEIRNSSGSLVGAEILEINGEYRRFTYDKLEKGVYTIRFIAENYNEGFTDITAESNKVIVGEEIEVEDGIEGNIALKSLLRQVEGKNYFDIENAQRWKSANGNSIVNNREYLAEDGAVVLYARNGWRTYAYYVPELAGKRVTVSFKAKLMDDGGSKLVPGLMNGDSNGSKAKDISNLTTEYKDYYASFVLNNKGYIGFYINENATANKTTALVLKDIQVEAGSSVTDFEPYRGRETYLATMKVDLVDKRREILSNNYRIKYYRFGEYVGEQEGHLDDAGKVSGAESTFDLDKNSTYTVKLVVMVGGVEYEIASTEFTTEEEIRSIETLTDFQNMHVTGKYLVANDLDFRNVTGVLVSDFYGSIDFQGHKLLMDAQGAPSQFRLITNYYGTLKNIDIHLYMNDSSAKNGFYGFAQNNYGTIENLFVTIEQSTDVGNISTTTAVGTNYGTINNFVVHLKVPIYGIRILSALCLNNNNMIRNGYIYGDDGASIKALDDDDGTNPKRVGAIAATQNGNGRLENVFSLLDVDSDGAGRRVGNLLGYVSNGATITHSFSNANGENRSLNDDANWISASTYSAQNFNLDKLYYVSDKIYKSNGSVRISPLALRDIDFENDTLNSYGAFDVNSYVEHGYYPQIILPEVMPNQEYLPLPAMGDEAWAVDVVAVTNVERQDDDRARVTLKLNNPSAAQVTEVKINNFSNDTNSNVVIESQTDNNGTTELVLDLSSPKFYYSKYGIGSLTYSIPYGPSKTIVYGTNDKVIDVEMYKGIYNINDWKEIKKNDNSVRENYVLKADLDFSNQPANNISIDYGRSGFYGRLNGNGHTIRNILIEGDYSMIKELYGIVENLFVEDYRNYNNNPSADVRVGFVAHANNGAKIKNVHMRDVELAANAYIGGLVGRLTGAIVQDSSVSGVSLGLMRSTYSSTRIGGIVGYMEGSSIIQNSFVQGVNFDVRENVNVYAIGGLVGQMTAGVIENVYSVGKMETRTPNNGGIVGLASGGGVLNYAYSNVDIYTSTDLDIGGIVGRVASPTQYSVANTLSVGTMYTSLRGGSLHRVIGSDVIVSQPNYAWADQHINGRVSDDTSGEILIMTSELNLASTYINIMGMGRLFSYDGVGDGSLPLLYSSDQSVILPNQDKNYLKIYDLKIISSEINQEPDRATVRFIIENRNGLDISGIEIDDAIVESVTVDENKPDGTTVYEVVVRPEYYYDSYRLSGIRYRVNGREEYAECDYKVEMQFYRLLYTADDWNNINGEAFENYRLMNDIDFGGVDNVKNDIYINRLEGIIDEGKRPTLKNIVVNGSGNNVGLIRMINSSLKQVNFEGIKVNNSSVEAVYKTGVIVYTYGEVQDVSYKNIEINATKSSYAGIVADSFSKSIRDIVIEKAKVSGWGRVGGYAGRISADAVNGVTIDDVVVNGGSSYVGGFAGQQSTVTYILQFDINANKVTINGGSSYVGGIYGYGTGSNLTVSNSEIFGDRYTGGISGYVSASQDQKSHVVRCSGISGKNVNGNTDVYVGGIAGYATRRIDTATVSGCSDGEGRKRVFGSSGRFVGGIYGYAGGTTSSNLLVENIDISSTDSYVGGVIGYNGGAQYATVYDVNVNGDAYVGGMIGSSGSIRVSTVNKVNVNAVGSNVGGVAGADGGSNQWNIEVTDTQVKGVSNVGGIVGSSSSSTNNQIYGCMVNATISATGSNAGGVVGYLYNTEETRIVNGVQRTYYVRQIYNNIVNGSTVSAAGNAGGLVGRMTSNLQASNRIYKNLVVADVTTTNSDNDPGVIIGNDDSLVFNNDGALMAVDVRVYDNSKMQKGSSVQKINDDGYNWNNFDKSSVTVVDRDGLAIKEGKNAYTGIGITLITSEMEDKYYPYMNYTGMKSMQSDYRKMVELPSQAEIVSAISPLAMHSLRSMALAYRALPDYRIYPSEANVLNVEFDDIDEDVIFAINGVEHKIDRRVFSFSYNYNADINFSMTNGISRKEMKYTPEDLRCHFATIGGNYYILKDDGEIISNDDGLGQYEAANIFKDKILTRDGTLISLTTKEAVKGEGGDVELLDEIVALYDFERQGVRIDAFAGFSVVDDLNVVEKQILYKGIQTELIDPALKNIKWQSLMDSYNNKDYLTVLGEDGVIYDLKNKLSYPENFDNNNIVEMSSNVLNDTYLMAVGYGDGRAVVFNYRNGNIVYRLQPDVIPTPLEYFAQEMASDKESLYDNERNQENLFGAQELMTEIKNGSVVSDSTSISVTGDYVVSFNPVKNEYEIYEMNDLLRVDPLGAMHMSVSDQIYGDNSLNLLFGHYLSGWGRRDNLVIFVYGGIVMLIVGSMVALGNLLRKKHSHFEKPVVK